jgi:hypothetical protein
MQTEQIQHDTLPAGLGAVATIAELETIRLAHRWSCSLIAEHLTPPSRACTVRGWFAGRGATVENRMRIADAMRSIRCSGATGKRPAAVGVGCGPARRERS